MSSGCGDVISLESMQIARKHQIFEIEVITGKSGGVAGGADIDYATNPVTGQTQKTLPAVLRDAGFSPVSWDFSTGGTLTVDDRDKVVYDPVSQTWYSYAGTLPVTVPAGFNPVGNADWKPKTDPDLRNDLASTAQNKGASMVAVEGGSTVQGFINDLKNSDGFDIIGAYAQIADLRSVYPTVGTTVLVKEHTTGRGADGGGVFVATSGTVTDDDGVHVASAATGIYWLRRGAGTHVKIEWFGGKSEDQSLDHSPILANAQLYEGRSIEFQYGSYYFTPPCTIKPSMHFIGSGGAKTFWRNKNINADATVFFANTGSASSWAENTVFERIHFSNDSSSTPSNAAISLQHVSLFKFDKCGFYKAPIYASNLHWVTWSSCVFIDSLTTINEASVSPSFPINEGPAFIDCYMVRSPIDVTDVADLRLVGTSMFYGPYGIKSTAHRPLDSGADSRGLPVFITNSVIDNIDGYCLDLNRVAVGTITNSLFSGGRVSGTPAIRATEVLGLSFNANVIHFAGQECMHLYDVQNLLMGNNQFSSCNGYAIKAEYCRNVVVNGNFFGNQKVSGGWNTCTGGVNFNTPDSLAWLITGNTFVGVPGVVGNTGSGRTVYRATANTGIADN